MEKVLQSDQLAAVLSVDKEHVIEPVASPQPFRFQPKLTLVVDYAEYKDFLASMPNDWDFLYRSPRSALAKETLKCFYMDVMRAVLHELYFASAVSRASCITVYPTRIRHRIEGAQKLQIPATCVRKDPVVKTLAEGIGCINILSKTYAAEWAYACALCELAQSLTEVNY